MFVPARQFCFTLHWLLLPAGHFIVFYTNLGFWNKTYYWNSNYQVYWLPMSTRNVRLRLSVLLDIALAVDTCRPLCCLLHKFRIMKQHLLLKLQLLGVLIAYEYSKCLSPPVSFASHCIGYCCLQATLLSFAQFLFCFALLVLATKVWNWISIITYLWRLHV